MDKVLFRVKEYLRNRLTPEQKVVFRRRVSPVASLALGFFSSDLK